MASIVFEYRPEGLDALMRTAPARKPIDDITARIWSRAASMSSGFRSGYHMDERRGHIVGGTYARYGHDVRVTSKGPVGLVWTDNYAAILDNSKNDTLLKAR